MNIDLVHKRSWAILVFLAALSQVKNFHVNLPLALLNIFLLALLYTWIIYLIVNIRGKNVNKHETSFLTKELGIWDYVWRSFAIQFISDIIFLIFIAAVLQIKIHPSLTISIVSSLFMAVASVPVTWAIFSNNRKQQLLLVFPFLGGILW